MKIFFNGKILYRKLTGIERYAWETLREINKKRPTDYYIAIPSTYSIEILNEFTNLKIIKIRGISQNFLWDQISLPLYAKTHGGIVASFDFTTSIIFHGISTIHDMSFKRNKELFSNTFRQRLIAFKLNLYCRSSVKSKYPIITVTEFQKKEILNFYSISPDRVIVAGNGWQHFIRINKDDTVFDKYKITPNSYYFSLSSSTPNKNFKWVYDVALRNHDSYFVIVGGNTSITKQELYNTKNIKYIGYQSDEVVKSLFENCKAFIFPSFYEGFGIPPMEALSVGAKIIISNKSCLPEIYRESAYYIDPNDPNVCLDDILLKQDVDNADNVLNKYSWRKTAEIWINLLNNL